VPTYWIGIGAKPEIPTLDIIDEMAMSTTIAAKSMSGEKKCQK